MVVHDDDDDDHNEDDDDSDDFDDDNAVFSISITFKYAYFCKFIMKDLYSPCM